MGQQTLSIPMIVLSAVGCVIVGTSILADFGLTPLGKWTIRAAGVALIAAGLLLA